MRSSDCNNWYSGRLYEYMSSWSSTNENQLHNMGLRDEYGLWLQSHIINMIHHMVCGNNMNDPRIAIPRIAM